VSNDTFKTSLYGYGKIFVEALGLCTNENIVVLVFFID
jgi:hypothetical protein